MYSHVHVSYLHVRVHINQGVQRSLLAIIAQLEDEANVYKYTLH